MKKMMMTTAVTMALGATGCWGATVAQMTGTSFSSNQESSSSRPAPIVVMSGAAGLIGLLLAGKRKKA